MIALKHKVIERGTRPFFYWRVGDALRNIESIRRRAEDFAGEVGAENVVSIVEHALPHFVVVVWYREDDTVKVKAPRVDEFFESSLAN